MRTLITAILFVFAMDAAGQAIPRFLFRPIVRPFDPRPVRGPHKYNKDKNGSTDPRTGQKGFDLNGSWNPWVDPLTGLPVPAGTPGAVLVNWFSMPGVNPLTGLPYDANQTSGAWSNRRITRWSTTTPGGNTLVNPQSNPNLRLYGRVNNGGINYFNGPQRQMIDDKNRSRSYVIPPNFTGGAVVVRPQYLGYSVSDFGENDGSVPAPNGDWPNKTWQDPVGEPAQPTGSRAATQPSTQLGIWGQWSRCYYWYDFNVVSQGRAGLEGLRDYSLAGLPFDVLQPPTGTNSVILAGIQASSPNVSNPVSIQMGYMIRVTRTAVAVTPPEPPYYHANRPVWPVTRDAQRFPCRQSACRPVKDWCARAAHWHS